MPGAASIRPFDQDNLVPRRIAELTGRRRFAPGVILEGGSIDVNGQGTVLATEQCLLNPNRNPQLSRKEMERCLADYLARRARALAARRPGWATTPTGTSTSWPASSVPSTVVAAVEQDPGDVNYASLKANYQRLSAMTDQDGRRLEVIPLPMPRPVVYARQRLPASYANFYIANGVVIVPQFADPADEEAIAVLAPCSPAAR